MTEAPVNRDALEIILSYKCAQTMLSHWKVRFQGP